MINDASANPPPNKINIFHGIFKNQFSFNMLLPLLEGTRKKSNPPKIAIIESVRLILK